MKPFLRWVGGKSRVVAQIAAHLPQKFGCYHEPFLGSGALFFALQPERAMLSDSNQDLIHAFTAVRLYPNELLADLAELPNTREDYLAIRAWDPTPFLSRASRFVYLNKTAFNGLYRVNRKGQFNVPYGKYLKPKIADAPTIYACSAALASVTLGCSSFDTTKFSPRPGDLVYLDPPYLPASLTAKFDRYTPGGFTLEDHIRLRDYAVGLAEMGVHVAVSNSDTETTHHVWGGTGFKFHQIWTRRLVAGDGSKRPRVTELLMVGG